MQACYLTEALHFLAHIIRCLNHVLIVPSFGSPLYRTSTYVYYSGTLYSHISEAINQLISKRCVALFSTSRQYWTELTFCGKINMYLHIFSQRLNPFTHTTNLQQTLYHFFFILDSVENLNKWKNNYLLNLRMLWQKVKLLIMSNVSIFHNVFKSCMLKMCQSTSVCREMLTRCVNNSPCFISWIK